MIILHLLHVLFATIWISGGFYYNFILLPNLERIDPTTQRSLTRSLTRVMGPLLGLSALITIVTGGVMMFQLLPEHGGKPFATGWGVSMLVGIITTILSLVLVFAIELPAENRLDRLAASIEGRSATNEERRQLQQLTSRVVFLGRLTTVLLLVALASMAVARYV
jgi:uncharacterized membrane protein